MRKIYISHAAGYDTDEMFDPARRSAVDFPPTWLA
jgi:hypothetical protein